MFRSRPLSKTPVQVRKRRVFFSFHYQEDVWRANAVRQSWRFGRESERETVGFFDASLWESSQRTNEESLKRLIREGMKNSPVTCVLAGASTYSRPWVRYEIARSVVCGNGLFTVHISGLRNQHRQKSSRGPNPLAYMGVYREFDGRILLAELDGFGRWVRPYRHYTQAVTLPTTWWRPTSRSVVPLSQYSFERDYLFAAGSANFSAWVHQAARVVGR